MGRSVLTWAAEGGTRLYLGGPAEMTLPWLPEDAKPGKGWSPRLFGSRARSTGCRKGWACLVKAFRARQTLRKRGELKNTTK